jgi:hypothetical protein
MKLEEALQIAIEELYERSGYFEENFAGFVKHQAYAKRLLEARDLLRKALEDAETDRLRAKKKQIYEDLKGAVDREWVGLKKGEIQEIVDRIKVDDLLLETSTWHIRFAQAVQRKLKEKNT